MSSKRTNSALREPPYANEAEQAVLGGLMLSDSALLQVSDWLSEDHFYRRSHRVIYRAICDLATKGQPHDAVTLGEWFHAQGVSEDVGGASYVIELANSTPSAANVAAYGEIVREKARLRELIDAGTALAGAAFAPGASASLIAADALLKLSAMSGETRLGGLKPSRGSVQAWWADLQRRYDAEEEMSGLPSPWPCLDAITLGWQDGDLIILAGRPSMGKSLLGFQAAMHNATANRRTDIFSLEMSEKQVVQRGVAALARIRHRALQDPRLLERDDWDQLMAAQSRIANAPLYIDDQPGLTALQICARARRQHLRSPTRLIVIDHLHEVKRQGRDLVNEIGEDARQFKRLAKELNVPVILLCQLSRANAMRSDHRPNLGDLRASGSIEEIADVVLFIHREDYYNRDTHLKGVIELILGKGRDLPIGETAYLENVYSEMRAVEWQGPLPKPTIDEKKGKKADRGLAAELKELTEKAKAA